MMAGSVSQDGNRRSAEGPAQALLHAKDAVDKSAWCLALLRKDLDEVPVPTRIMRLHMRDLLADLGKRQASLSAAYFGMATAAPGKGMIVQMNDFFDDYDRFMDALRAARMASRRDYRTGVGMYSAVLSMQRRGSSIDAANDGVRDGFAAPER